MFSIQEEINLQGVADTLSLLNCLCIRLSNKVRTEHPVRGIENEYV